MSGSVDVDYLEYHARRFAYVLKLLREFAPPDAAVLDVGVSPFVQTLRAEWPGLTTLGLPLETTRIYDGPHIPFDLLTAEGATPPTDQRFDVIIFGEVIEHLYQSPEVSLRFLRSLLKPGGRLILQTPNAAALVKRLALLVGRHPFDPLRTDPDNPGHVREYTGHELIAALETSGFAVERHVYASYFWRPPARGLGLGRRARLALEVMIPAFRDGQTVIARPT